MSILLGLAHLMKRQQHPGNVFSLCDIQYIYIYLYNITILQQVKWK